jgi:hypothetical protein
MANLSSLVFSGIAPHPPIMVPEVGRESIAGVVDSIDAMAELTKARKSTAISQTSTPLTLLLASGLMRSCCPRSYELPPLETMRCQLCRSMISITA